MNKNTKITIISVVAVVVLIIIGILVWDGKNAQAPTTVGTSTTNIASSTMPIGSSTATSSISVSLYQTYSGKSFSFHYPLAWGIVTVSPFSLTTFGNNYVDNEFIPAGGAVINIATTTAQGSVQNIINTETMNAFNATTTTLTVDGVACPAVAFEAAYAPGQTSKNVSVYCSRGSELWKIYLSYNASDTTMGTHVADFNSVLASMKFLP